MSLKVNSKKSGIKVPAVTAQVQGGTYRLGGGLHSTVFPEHIPGGGEWHGSPRQPHGGSFSIKSSGRK